MLFGSSSSLQKVFIDPFISLLSTVLDCWLWSVVVFHCVSSSFLFARVGCFACGLCCRGVFVSRCGRGGRRKVSTKQKSPLGSRTFLCFDCRPRSDGLGQHSYCHSTLLVAILCLKTMSAVVAHLDISQLPSLKDGMSADEEATKRRKTCRFIEEAGRVLKLPRVAISTAMVFFHRFYAKHSFQDHDRFEVAVAAIVLAAKTEESPKKLNTVILQCHELKTRGMQAGRVKGSNPAPPATLDTKGEEFSILKERILLMERVILHTIGFELSIDHPYKFFVDQIKKLTQTRQLVYKTPPPNLNTSQTYQKMMNELVQFSMSFANDSMHTSLCLQFSSQLIATACVYLAGQFAKVETQGGSTWAKVLGGPDIESLASICVQILDLIDPRKTGGDLEHFKKIRTQLEVLKSSKGRSHPEPPPSEPSAKRPKIG